MNVVVCKFVMDMICKLQNVLLILCLAEWANRGINLWTVKKQEKTLAADTTNLTGTNLFGSGCR